MIRQRTTALTVVSILVLGAVAAAPVAGHSGGHGPDDAEVTQHGTNATVVSTFDDGTEGWSLYSDEPAENVTYRSDGGNPGGHVANDDTKGGDTWYYDSPSKFLGNKSAYYGGAMTFDLQKEYPRGDNPYDSFDIGAIGDVVLRGDGRSISYDLGGPEHDPRQNWTSYGVPLNASDAGWVNTTTQERISDAEMRAVLGDLDRVLIRGEWRVGSDSSTLDNVEFDAHESVEIEERGTVDLAVTMDGEPTDAQIVVRPQSAPETVQAVRYTALGDEGNATFDLPAGQYQLEIDAGGGHLAEREYVDVTVPSGGETSASVDVTQLYEPNDRGWYAIDPHAHSPWANATNAHDNSEPNETIPGSPNTRGDAWVTAHLAAQLDAVAVSDHNMVDGHTPVKERATDRNAPYLLSEEISTSEWGHHLGYPLEEGNVVQWTGNMSEVYADARDSGAEAVHVAHPYYNGEDPDGIGYFADLNRSGFNYSFDAAEVYNGLDEKADENRTIQEMYSFWNDGRQYAVTSVSDNHDALTHGPDTGTPRTYAYGDPGAGAEPDGSAWAAAVKNQHTFATYGPLVYFTAGDGAIPGDRVTAENGTITLSADLRNAEGDLTNARLVRNGTVVESFDLDSREETISYDAQVNGTGWFVLRVTDEDGDRAMTSPIWVEGDGESAPDPSPTGNEFDVTLTNASDGLQSFNLTVSADSPIANVDSDLLADRFLQVTEKGNSSVRIRGADLGKEVGATDDAITLATITLSEDASDEAVTVSVDSLTDDAGDSIDADAVTIERAGLFVAPLPGSGADAAPTDPDDDGRYEDVDGDGDVDFDDAVSLAFVDHDALSAEQRAALDVDGDGIVGFEDAIELAFQA